MSIPKVIKKIAYKALEWLITFVVSLIVWDYVNSVSKQIMVFEQSGMSAEAKRWSRDVILACSIGLPLYVLFKCNWGKNEDAKISR